MLSLTAPAGISLLNEWCSGKNGKVSGPTTVFEMNEFLDLPVVIIFYGRPSRGKEADPLAWVGNPQLVKSPLDRFFSIGGSKKWRCPCHVQNVDNHLLLIHGKAWPKPFVIKGWLQLWSWPLASCSSQTCQLVTADMNGPILRSPVPEHLYIQYEAKSRLVPWISGNIQYIKIY